MTGSGFADGGWNAEPQSFRMNFLRSSAAILSPVPARPFYTNLQ
jgi:hypothetical protein